MSKRISFSEADAMHIYELALEHFCDMPLKACAQCVIIKDRLECFIGSVNRDVIKKTIRKNGYCTKLKGK